MNNENPIIIVQCFDGKIILPEASIKLLGLEPGGFLHIGKDEKQGIFAIHKSSNKKRLKVYHVADNPLQYAVSSVRATRYLAVEPCKTCTYRIDPKFQYQDSNYGMVYRLEGFEILERWRSQKEEQEYKNKLCGEKFRVLLDLTKDEYHKLYFDLAFEHMEYQGYAETPGVQRKLGANSRYWNWWSMQFHLMEQEALNNYEFEGFVEDADPLNITPFTDSLRQEALDNFTKNLLRLAVFPPSKLVEDALKGDQNQPEE